MQIYYPDEVHNGPGKWWNAIIVGDASPAGPSTVTSPYDVTGLWERFTVAWGNTLVRGQQAFACYHKFDLAAQEEFDGMRVLQAAQPIQSFLCTP